MATLPIQPPQWHRTPYNNAPEIKGSLLEADSQTFLEGDLVYSNAGAVTVCGADPTQIAGLAAKAGTNVTSGNAAIPFMVIRGGDEFIMSLYHATPASALQSGVSVGTAYEIARVTVSGATCWCVDMAETTNERVVVVDLYPSDATTDLYGRVIVRFLNTALDGATQRNNVLQLWQ